MSVVSMLACKTALHTHGGVSCRHRGVWLELQEACCRITDMITEDVLLVLEQALQQGQGQRQAQHCHWRPVQVNNLADSRLAFWCRRAHMLSLTQHGRAEDVGTMHHYCHRSGLRCSPQNYITAC